MKPKSAIAVVISPSSKPHKGSGGGSMVDEDNDAPDSEEEGGDRDEALKGAYRALKGGDEEGFVEWMKTALEC
jgi:hypothetical protein